MSIPFRLLVAYDGSPCADKIMEDLKNAGIPGSAQVLIVSVAERWLGPPSIYEVATKPILVRGEEHAVRTAQLGASQLLARHPEWAIESEGHTGSPVRVILQRAREWEAQLVVVGSLGHNAVERMLIGSVSQKVANEAHCSVRVSRGRRGPGGLRLLLAYDARPGSEIAAEAVAARNWPKATSVRLTVAVGFNGAPMGECSLPEAQSHVESLLAPAIEILSKTGLEVHVTIKEADPKILIVEEATRLDADCVFAGCNDHSIVDRLLLGTVSGALISRAPCAVEIVR